MTHTRFLKIALPVLALPALVTLFLPEKTLEVYVDIVEPLSLIVASFLALWVSFIYRKQLKAAFVSLSVFLFVYALAIILLLAYNAVLIPALETRFDTTDLHILVTGVQFVNYAILIFFCANLLKAINVSRLTRAGWFLVTGTVVLCLLLALYPVKDLLANFGSLGMADVFSIVMRVLDALLIIALVPVILLYVQYVRSHQQQSLTFTVIISGIVCATVLDYLFEFIITLFPGLLAQGSLLRQSIPEALFMLGYLVIAAGLYAHRKQDEWGFNTVNKMMSFDLELTGEL